MQPAWAKDVGRKNTKVYDKQPEDEPVKPFLVFRNPERHAIASERNDVGVCLWAVAEQDDEPRKHTKTIHSEVEILPPLVVGKEAYAKQGEDSKLYQTVVRQEKLLQSSGKQQSYVVAVAMVACYHLYHFVICGERIVVIEVYHGGKQKDYSEEGCVGKVPPCLGVAEEQSKFRSAINLCAGRKHDEKDSPHALAPFEERIGKDEYICHHSIVLVAEDGLQKNWQQEPEYSHLVLVELLRESPDGEEEENEVADVPHVRS